MNNTNHSEMKSYLAVRVSINFDCIEEGVQVGAEIRDIFLLEVPFGSTEESWRIFLKKYLDEKYAAHPVMSYGKKYDLEWATFTLVDKNTDVKALPFY